MNHKGIEYTVTATATPGVWKWQFRIGDEVKTGKTETKINLLAIRRVQLRIDRELKKAARDQLSSSTDSARFRLGSR
jgi:hypothetical protein